MKLVKIPLSKINCAFETKKVLNELCSRHPHINKSLWYVAHINVFSLRRITQIRSSVCGVIFPENDHEIIIR